MSLCVVVPVLNEAQGLDAFLKDLSKELQGGVQVWFADGGSTDGTHTLACNWLAERGVPGHCLATERGRAVQMNTAARAAMQAGGASQLLFLHADTRLPDGAVDLVRKALDQHPLAWGRFDVAIDGRAPMLKLVGFCMNLRSRLTGIATGDQAIFMTTKAFEAIGGYAQQPLMEDIEASKALKRLRAPVCLRERVRTSGRRWESRGVWRTIALMWWMRWAYWRGVPAERLARAYR